MTKSLLSDQLQNIKLNNKSYSLEHNNYVFMLALLYTNGYASGIEIEIMIDSDLWTWNLILNGLMYNI